MADTPAPTNTNEKLNAKKFSKSGGVVEDNTTGKNFKYKVGSLTYPYDVDSADYPHFVVFYINIRGKSKYNGPGGSYQTAEVTSAGQNRVNETKAGDNLNVAGTIAGAYGGYKATNALLANTNLVKNAKTRLALGVAGAAAGAAIAEGTFEGDKKFRIDTAVMLAVNDRPSTQYRAEYRATDLGSLGGFIAGGSSATDSATDFAGESVKAAIINAMQIPAAITTNLDPKSLISVGTGMALNPFREQVFQNMETRTFSFDYKFLPRNAAETQAAQKIIEQFKFHMHPELSKGGMFYIYPSTFDIQYYFNGNENPYVNKISECVLSAMKVDYGNQNQVSSFADGAPTEINMSLTFVELEVLTKERIVKGY
jgi:hypothetical protein